MAEVASTPERPAHHRAKSSVLKSIMVTRSHKKLPSEGALCPPTLNDQAETYPPDSSQPFPSPSKADQNHNPLCEIQQNANRSASPSKKEKKQQSSKSPQKIKSSVSVRNLFDGAGRDLERERKSAERGRKKENVSPEKPKKSKSSTSLSSVFMRANKSSKNLQDASRNREKENTTPPASAGSELRTPIWAQFATTGLEQDIFTTPSPTKYQGEVEERTAQGVYRELNDTKQKYGPGENVPVPKQPRPRSAYLPKSTIPLSYSDEPRGSDERSDGRRPRSHSRPDPEKRNSRVLAAIAALTGNSKVLEIGSSRLSQDLQDREIDTAFEAVLNERNVPENMRAGMRGLTARVKIDFIMNSRQTPPGTMQDRQVKAEDDTNRRRGRSKPPKSAGSDGSKTDVGPAETHESSATGATKHTRSRSKTFTFSKDSLSPSKKRKASQETDASQSEPASMPKSPSSKSLVSLNSQNSSFASSGRKTPKPPLPQEYVSYLRKVHKPEIVEVGKLHKLRLLLRNETVTWVDDFIQQGGMTEVIELLRRIMQVEWREEHEDQLLHEVLLCLKGLCTTDRALRKLCEVESSLFPALLKMIFDEEKKGPSEFTTRGIVVNLLFTHLAAAMSGNVSERSRVLLSYLRDPLPPEDSQPLNFISEMYQSRPYRVWCKEIVSITKEVFWIFLHHHNVIPMGENYANTSKESEAEQNAQGSCTTNESYVSRHFPKTRPPVPAAPYIGGVEWDATNYIAGHLDLMNGLIASLPTSQERNNVRRELRASGFEKCMGISLRTCKEKFYGAVHDCLKTWIMAAAEDGWPMEDVRFGPKKEDVSPKKSPTKNKGSPAKKEQGLEALKLDVGSPKLELGLGLDGVGEARSDGEVAGWL
ncbi:MAG: hypothetical protein M1822_003520 [Bathelium mastoideum]|nr:MAG: hypothetical protein M1822_003520 [Bathelium mastoideum]